LPKEIKEHYPVGIIMVVLKPLYGVAEAGTHWWATYSRYYKDKLSIVTLTYNPCLLVTNTKDRFVIVGIQTDDILSLLDSRFTKLEQSKLDKAGFSAKPKELLSSTNVLQFNGCILKLIGQDLTL